MSPSFYDPEDLTPAGYSFLCTLAETPQRTMNKRGLGRATRHYSHHVANAREGFVSFLRALEAARLVDVAWKTNMRIEANGATLTDEGLAWLETNRKKIMARHARTNTVQRWLSDQRANQQQAEPDS